MGSRRRLTAPSPSAIVLALAVLIGGIVAAGTLRSVERHRAEERAAADAAEVALVVDALLDEAADVVDTAARSMSPYTTTATAVSDGTLLGVVVTDDRLAPDDRGVSFAAALAAPGMAVTAGSARDEGLPAASDRFGGEDGAGSVLIVAPVFRTEAPLATVGDRHAALLGYVVAEVGLAGVLDAAARATGVFGSIVDLADDVASDRQAVRLAALGRNWQIAVDVDDEGVGGVPLGLLLGAIVTASVIVGVSVAQRRARVEARRVALRNERQIALVNDVGAVLHSSLDLGDVLPAVAVRLADDFDLIGFAMAVASSEGVLDDVFTMGVRQDDAPRHVRDLPGRGDTTGAASDPTTLTMPLEQSGRTVGALWICGRAPFTRDQRDRIRPIADLAGSAIGNARAYAQESDARRHLAELDHMNTEFLGTASHELRTPATTIEGFAQLLDNGWDDLPEDQRHDLVHRIARNARSLSQLLEQLLAFTRMERHSLVMELETHDLDEIVRRVIELSTPLLEHHAIVLRSEGPTLAVVDPVAVERVLLNLLTNASKYSPPATDIEVDVEPAGERVVLRVTDHGPGIPLEERHLIFERFYRGGSQHALRTRGAGIGLAVVKELVERLGATIEVTEAPGGGSCFTVLLVAAHMSGAQGGGSSGPA